MSDFIQRRVLHCLAATMLVGACPQVAGQDAPARVTVTATRDPVDKSTAR